MHFYPKSEFYFGKILLFLMFKSVLIEKILIESNIKWPYINFIRIYKIKIRNN